MKAVRLTEHDWEPIRGLPGRLPPGETLLWQGSPNWRSLAIRALHVRKIAIYMALLVAWRVGAGIGEAEPTASILASLLWIVPLALAGVALPALLAWLYARTTVYSITSRRVVVRSGVALPVAVNIPFKVIGAAALARHADGTGDLPLTLTAERRMSWVQLWPNVRPWRLTRPEPMLRSVPDAAAVAELLSQALRAAQADAAAPDIRVVRTPPAEAPRGAKTAPQPAVA